MRVLLRPLALLAVPLLVLTGCGSGAGDEAAPAAGSPASGAEAGAFPVMIKHKYGSTELTAPPQRVVAVGLVEQDPLLALGIVPVGTTEWFGEQPGALYPWAKEKLGDGTLPTVLSDKDGVQFERVAALRPDLIIGLYAGTTADEYRKLSEIAPTVAQPVGAPDFGTAWQDVTRVVGQAVGKPKQADELVRQVERRIADVRTAHPEFRDQQALMATTYEGYFVYGSQDPRSRLLTEFGFRLPAGLDQQIGDKFGGSISSERIAVLDQKALVWFPTKGGTAKLKADPLYRNLAVRTQGRDVFVEEDSGDVLYGATTFVSVLSLPIVLEQLVPRLSAAVDGDPASSTDRVK